MNLDELQKIAESATPGPWRVIPGDSYCAYSAVVCDDKTLIFEDHEGHDPGECRKNGECGMPDDHTDATFVAAFNPQTALKLIADLRKARYALDYLSRVIYPQSDHYQNYASKALSELSHGDGGV